jgi:hypothetical protein
MTPFRLVVEQPSQALALALALALAWASGVTRQSSRGVGYEAPAGETSIPT